MKFVSKFQQKNKTNENNSRAVANSLIQEKYSGNELEFVDNRAIKQIIQRPLSNQHSLQRYKLKAGDSEYLSEQRFVNGKDEIQFGGFSSCLGVVTCNSSGKLSGVHLVLFSRDEEYVPDKDQKKIAQGILSKLGEAQCGLIFGFVEEWKNDCPVLFTEIKKGLDATPGKCSEIDNRKGAWKIKYDNIQGWLTEDNDKSDLFKAKRTDVETTEKAESWDDTPHVDAE